MVHYILDVTWVLGSMFMRPVKCEVCRYSSSFWTFEKKTLFFTIDFNMTRSHLGSQYLYYNIKVSNILGAPFPNIPNILWVVYFSFSYSIVLYTYLLHYVKEHIVFNKVVSFYVLCIQMAEDNVTWLNWVHNCKALFIYTGLSNIQHCFAKSFLCQKNYWFYSWKWSMPIR